MTIGAQKRVFIVSENIEDICQLYVCEILEIKITTDRYVYYLLKYDKYDKSEAEKNRIHSGYHNGKSHIKRTMAGHIIV